MSAEGRGREAGDRNRRMEVVFGGPARPFPLTVRDADTLSDAMSALIEQFQKESLRDGGDDGDPDIIERMRELRERLWQHAGYGPRKRGD